MNNRNERQIVRQAIDHSLGQLKGKAGLAEQVIGQSHQPSRGRFTLAMGVAWALLLAAAVALAAYGGLLDFLHLPTLGQVETVHPQWEQIQSGDVEIEVTEAASDGISAHLLLRLTARNRQDALLLLDDGPEKTGFASQYEGKRTLHVTPMELQTGEAFLWPNVQCRYESPASLSLDMTVDLRELDCKDSLTVSVPILTCTQQDDGQTTDEATATVQVIIPLQRTAQKTYRAGNLPISGPGYVLKSLTLTQTDMACYLDTEWEDDVSLEQAMAEPGYPQDEEAQNEWMQQRFPLGGSFWVKVLDENGTPYQNLNGGESQSLAEEEDEQNHILISTFVQRFQVGQTLTLQPYSWEAQGEFEPIVVEFVP